MLTTKLDAGQAPVAEQTPEESLRDRQIAPKLTRSLPHMIGCSL
jgi:hypothetical protein